MRVLPGGFRAAPAIGAGEDGLTGELPRCEACGLTLFAAGVPCPRCGTLHGPARQAPDPNGAAALHSLDRLLAAFSPDQRFEVIDTLGRGGMGVVYKVRDRELDEVVALKVLDPLFGGSASAVDRFKSEVRIARRINHPLVARLYELFLWHERLAISMEFISGRSLDEILADKPLALASIRRYLRYLASALDAAHRLGVVHRDLKPANVLVDAEDRPHVLDFGIATLTGVPNPDSPGSVFGTPFYMSPEQAFRPERVDHRSDVYSLGIVLYRMASGCLPFVSDDAQEVFHAHLSDPPVPPSRIQPGIPAGLETVILRCLEKEPERRYPSAGDVHRHLEELLGETTGEAAAAGEPRRSGGVRGRALVVDDDRLARRMVGDLLRGIGVEVLEAKDGFEGVDLAMRERPDLIFLDLVMPVLDGREALRILKSNPKTSPIPVVMLTGLTDPEEAILSKEVGASVFLNKPVEPDVIELLVEKYSGTWGAAER